MKTKLISSVTPLTKLKFTKWTEHLHPRILNFVRKAVQLKILTSTLLARELVRERTQWWDLASTKF